MVAVAMAMVTMADAMAAMIAAMTVQVIVVTTTTATIIDRFRLGHLDFFPKMRAWWQAIIVQPKGAIWLAFKSLYNGFYTLSVWGFPYAVTPDSRTEILLLRTWAYIACQHLGFMMAESPTPRESVGSQFITHIVPNNGQMVDSNIPHQGLGGALTPLGVDPRGFTCHCPNGWFVVWVNSLTYFVEGQFCTPCPPDP